MPTLADVAKRANVSKMTVSRVINHPTQMLMGKKPAIIPPANITHSENTISFLREI